MPAPYPQAPPCRAASHPSTEPASALSTYPQAPPTASTAHARCNSPLSCSSNLSPIQTEAAPDNPGAASRFRNPQKINLKKVTFFQPSKTPRKEPQLNHKNTTTSPQKNHQYPLTFPQPPAKN